MRPKAVRQAEATYGASILLMAVMAAQAWKDTVAGIGFVGTLAANVGVIALMTALLLLATRRRARWAVWLLLGLTAIGVGGFLWQVASGVLSTGMFGMLTTVQTASALIAMVLLFRPTARAWFAHEPAPIEDVA